MKKNTIKQESQNRKDKSGHSAPEKNKEFQENKPAENDNINNDPTREDKPPLIISKL